MGSVTIFDVSAQNVNANGNTSAFNVAPYEGLKFYVNLTALSGGTSPTVQFFYQESDDYGTFYDVNSLSTALAAAGTNNTSIGKGLKLPDMVGKTGRVRWAVTGAPTTATATVTIVADEDD